MEKSRKYDICKNGAHRASYAKHLRTKKHLDYGKRNETRIPEFLFQEHIENNIEKLYNPNSLKQIAIEKFKLDDKQLIKELNEKVDQFIFFH